MESGGSWDWQPVDPTRKAPELRASDADRQRAVDALLEHCTAGRLTLDELDERQGQAMQARTLGELRAVFHDLPDTGPDLPVAAQPGPVPPNREQRRRAARRRDRSDRHGGRAAGSGPWAAYVGTSALLVVIWALAGHHGFWPGWFIGVVGAGLVVRQLRGGR